MLKQSNVNDATELVERKSEVYTKTPYLYDDDFNSTLTIGGINPSFYEGDITYYSTADCVNCWNLTTDSLSLVTPTETTELVDAKTAPEVTIQFQTAYPYIALY